MKTKECINELKIKLPSYSVNESSTRTIVASFCAALNPTVEELADIRCAVSEAVTNCIVHGYRDTIGSITVDVRLYSDRSVKIDVRDKGCGIADVERAMEALFTTAPDGERSGMGFTVMENFMDTVSVKSVVGRGTRVTMRKKLSALQPHK